jgi:ubiquinol-cytochrome c reductase iron-sulfur subunit
MSDETIGDVPSQPQRRDFLTLLAGASAAIGVGAVAWPLIDSMNPAADTLAAGGSVDVDLTPLEPGQQIIVMWRSKPIFIVNRPATELASLQNSALLAILRDPDSKVLQQPPYAKNWHRSSNPQYAVLVGICTHLGCIPHFYPSPSPSDPARDWLGGYFCPCHGSKYDLAGRVFDNVPAPYNLPVPPYSFPSKNTLRIGENPVGVTFDISQVVQM